MSTRRRQIHHVTLRVADGESATTFYMAALSELGMERNIDEHGRTSFGTADGHDFGFYSDGERAYQRAHIAFAATSRTEVDRFHDAALRHGGASLDPPRDRPEFGGLYSAYLTDPEGNTVEVVYDPSVPRG